MNQDIILLALCVILYGYLLFDIFDLRWSRVVRIALINSLTIKIVATIIITLAMFSAWFLCKREISSLSLLTEDGIKSLLSYSEYAVLGASTVLIAGLLGEWPDDDRWKKSSLYTIAKLLVIAGVAAELLSNELIFATTDALQAAGEQKIADARKAAADALESATGAIRRATYAEREAAETMKAAAWRQILPDQRSTLLETLNTSQHKVNLVWIANDSEALSLAIQLSEVFKQAKWEVLP